MSLTVPAQNQLRLKIRPWRAWEMIPVPLGIQIRLLFNSQSLHLSESSPTFHQSGAPKHQNHQTTGFYRIMNRHREGDLAVVGTFCRHRNLAGICCSYSKPCIHIHIHIHIHIYIYMFIYSFLCNLHLYSYLYQYLYDVYIVLLLLREDFFCRRHPETSSVDTHVLVF